MMFILEMMDGVVVNQNTKFKKKDGSIIRVNDELGIARLIRANFLRLNNNKSFKEYEMPENVDENEVSYDALDTICSNYVLNIHDGECHRYVNLYEFFKKISKTNPDIML